MALVLYRRDPLLAIFVQLSVKGDEMEGNFSGEKKKEFS